MQRFGRRLADALRAGALAVGMILATATAANAFNFCALATAKTYDEASRRLESAGCRVSREDGTTKRSFVCPDGQWASLEKSGYSGTSIVASGPYEDRLDAACGGAKWRSPTLKYDNPLVAGVLALGSDNYAAVISLDGAVPYLTQICTGSIMCDVSFDEGLRETLKSKLGDGTLTFRPSEVRVAGLDITRARRQDLERELAGRGASAGSARGGPLVADVTFNQISGVPGLSEIQVKFLLNRVALVRYPIASEPDYQTFTRSLDERYGVSSPVQANGCAGREWRNGGVTIIGRYCAAKPADSGFIFANTGAMAIVDGLAQMVAAPQATLPTPPRPKSDMY